MGDVPEAGSESFPSHSTVNRRAISSQASSRIVRPVPNRTRKDPEAAAPSARERTARPDVAHLQGLKFAFRLWLQEVDMQLTKSGLAPARSHPAPASRAR